MTSVPRDTEDHAKYQVAEDAHELKNEDVTVPDESGAT
jgi:hypothetical protein